MTSSIRLSAALALLVTALPATAWVRETTTVGHPESGLCLWWRARQVTYRINATSASYTPCGDAALAASTAAAGLASWGSATRSGEGAACTDFSFVNGGTTTQTALGKDGVNLVVFRTRVCGADIPGFDASCRQTPGRCAAMYNCWEHDLGTIALTTTSFDAETGELWDADMELFAWDGIDPLGSNGHYYFTCEGPGAQPCKFKGETGCNAVDVGAVVTHEAGHMLGLDHVCSSRFVAPFNECPDAASVMVPAVGEVSRRVLVPDDVAGVCTIYPAGAGTLTCLPGGAVPPEKSDEGGGCSSAGGAGVLGLLATVAGLRRRRRSP